MKRAVKEDFKRVPEVKFNTCDEPNYAYEVLVHEAGHVLARIHRSDGRWG